MSTTTDSAIGLRAFIIPRAPGAKKIETVSGLVLDAVEETVQGMKDPMRFQTNIPTLEAKSMLGVVTYCYVKGVLRSGDVERNLWKDKELAASCSEQIPTAQTISRFRRLNREKILVTLEKALRKIRQAFMCTAFSQEPPLPSLLQKKNLISEVGEGTTILVHKEALDRIQRAVQLDSMDADD